jgi:hypothetical protein
VSEWSLSLVWLGKNTEDGRLSVGSQKANEHEDVTAEKIHPIIIDSVILGSELYSSIVESLRPIHCPGKNAVYWHPCRPQWIQQCRLGCRTGSLQGLEQSYRRNRRLGPMFDALSQSHAVGYLTLKECLVDGGKSL